MHIVAMKKSVHDANPWAARNLYAAFDESRRRSVERILDPAVSRYPVAWLPIYARKMQGVFGKELFPFGIEANRKTWEMMGLYTYQQGIAHRQFAPEEIFPASIETKVII
jgi:4,5-dihydroxyphthalate decarboxylase